jgi:hypothetical protein
MSVSTEWLKKINQEFRDEGLEQRKRPMKALCRYGMEFKISVGISSPIAKEIFAWFKARSKPGVDQIGSLFESVYYFDTEFWTVSIPVFSGTVRIDAPDSLQEMPESLKDDLVSNPRSASEFACHHRDCLDYGVGIGEVEHRSDLDSFGVQLLKAADHELRLAVTQLKERRPDPRAILTCRMTTELFLKAYIALKVGLSREQARKELSHDLGKAFDKFVAISGHTILSSMKGHLAVYPPVEARYDEQHLSHGSVWEGFRLAQFLGAVIVRDWASRDTLPSPFRPANVPPHRGNGRQPGC